MRFPGACGDLRMTGLSQAPDWMPGVCAQADQALSPAEFAPRTAANCLRVMLPVARSLSVVDGIRTRLQLASHNIALGGRLVTRNLHDGSPKCSHSPSTAPLADSRLTHCHRVPRTVDGRSQALYRRALRSSICTSARQ
jgi:hypothetical protein